MGLLVSECRRIRLSKDKRRYARWKLDIFGMIASEENKRKLSSSSIVNRKLISRAKMWYGLLNKRYTIDEK